MQKIRYAGLKEGLVRIKEKHTGSLTFGFEANVQAKAKEKMDGGKGKR